MPPCRPRPRPSPPPRTQTLEVHDTLPEPVRLKAASDSGSYPDPRDPLKLAILKDGQQKQGRLTCGGSAEAPIIVHCTAPVVELRTHLLRTVRCVDPKYVSFCEALCGCAIMITSSGELLPRSFSPEDWHRAHVTAWCAASGEHTLCFERDGVFRSVALQSQIYRVVRLLLHALG